MDPTISGTISRIRLRKRQLPKLEDGILSETLVRARKIASMRAQAKASEFRTCAKASEFLSERHHCRKNFLLNTKCS